MSNNYKEDTSTKDIEIFETICLWADLLGYGRPFYESNWDLTSEMSRQNLKRIKFLEKMIKIVPNPLIEKVLFLNDGMIRNVDICKQGSYVEMLIMWLEYTIKQFWNINYLDKNNGNPGIRGVLTYGQRAQYTNEITKKSDVVKYKNNKVNEEIVLYSPNEFQMNTAFSKAYIIESSGSKCGISGPNLYVDEHFIDKFIQLLNESELQELAKLYEDSVESYMAKFYGNFQKTNDALELDIKVSIEGQVFDYMKVSFDNDAVCYNNEGANIKTNLYKVVSLWTVENGFATTLC